MTLKINRCAFRLNLSYSLQVNEIQEKIARLIFNNSNLIYLQQIVANQRLGVITVYFKIVSNLYHYWKDKSCIHILIKMDWLLGMGITIMWRWLSESPRAGV